MWEGPLECNNSAVSESSFRNLSLSKRKVPKEQLSSVPLIFQAHLQSKDRLSELSTQPVGMSGRQVLHECLEQEKHTVYKLGVRLRTGLRDRVCA